MKKLYLCMMIVASIVALTSFKPNVMISLPRYYYKELYIDDEVF